MLSVAKNNHLKVVKFLISEGADSAVQDNEGDNVFLIAAKNGYLKIIDFFAHDMKNKKIDLSTIKDANNNTLLHLAATNDHIKLIKYLVYFHNFDLEAKNKDGNTPSTRLKKHIIILSLQQRRRHRIMCLISKA